MANFKLNNPQVVGKLKLPAETANKVLTVDSSGQVTSATASTTELGYLVGVTSAIQTQISAKADASALSGYVPTTTTVNGHALSANVSVTKSDVGLGNVDNTSDANKPVSTATQTALDLKADLVGGVIPITQIPPAAIERLVIVANQAARYALTTATVQNGDTVKDADTTLMYFVKDDTQLSSAAGYEAYTAGGAASVPWTGITGIPTPVSSLTGTNTGDQDLSGLVLKTTTVNGHALSSNVTVSASDVGLGNVANVNQIPMSYLDTDGTLAANSDTKVASQKATKTYIDAHIGASAVAGDISLTTFAASNNISSPANVTGLAFAAGTVRGFKAIVTVAITATSSLNEVFELIGVQTASGFVMATNSVGDDSGVVFSITSAGQVQYTSTNISGFTANKIAFRAEVTNV